MVFQVIIRFDGENKTLTVAPTEAQALRTTVRELKELFIKTLPAAPDPDRIRLVFGDKQLEDDDVLEDYHIHHHSLIIAVVRIPGGGCPDWWASHRGEPEPPDSDKPGDKDASHGEPPKRRRSAEMLFYPNMKQ
ncbi:hypothetical protein NFI96_027818 [Prochilodus magdalenae]|nr:hypothetical protein NFI96_027818 [Prochilodus magdalenae]